MDDVDFIPASQDVALAELRHLHADSKIRRGDYYLILQALIPGGGLLDSMLGRRIAAAQRIQGLAALDRVAHQLHEASHSGLRCAITGLAEKEATPR